MPGGLRLAGLVAAGSMKTRDIPSPVLTGQVQRVWISAGSMRGTPCQFPSLAFPAGNSPVRTFRDGAPWRTPVNGLAGTARTDRCYVDSARYPRAVVSAGSYSSDAGTPTPRMIGSLAAGFAASFTGSGALASWTDPAAADGVAARCCTDVSLAAPWARLALRFRRTRRGAELSAAAAWRAGACVAGAAGAWVAGAWVAGCLAAFRRTGACASGA